jgi:hypothetical protein
MAGFIPIKSISNQPSKSAPKSENSALTNAEVAKQTREVEPTLKVTKPNSGAGIQVSKDAILGASRRQEKLDRERKILGADKRV